MDTRVNIKIFKEIILKFVVIFYFSLKSYLLLTKTHLYGLTQKANRKNGMVEISVRHPLSSIIKIATKSSCPEMISFTYGEKLSKPLMSSLKLNTTEQETSLGSIKPNDETSSVGSSTKKESNNSNNNSIENEYDIKGKDWFFVPDYAGEAASAVKLQCLQILSLTDN